MTEILKIDPSGAMLAFEKMMRKQIVMPAVLMGVKEVKTLPYLINFQPLLKKWVSILVGIMPVSLIIW